jgi:phospholipid/cholesterol/gamma-HCH transport system substrate-binding protein
MENNANYALVGALSMALIAALFGFVYWFAGPASSVAVKPLDVVFTGTVSGLSTGTDVLFNGVKVGQVRTVSLDPEDTNRVVVRTEIAESTPVRADTRTVMGFQGLTGIGSIQFSGGTQAAGDPVPPPGGTVPRLFAEASDFQSVLDGLASTVTGANSAVDRLNTFLEANTDKLGTTIEDVQSFSAALAANSEGVGTFLSSISDAGREIGPMAGEIRELSAEVRSLLDAIPADQVTKVVGDVGNFTDTLSRNSERIDAFFASTSTLSSDLGEITTSLKSSASTIEQVTAQIDPAKVGNVVNNIDSFATKLGDNADNFDTIVANVTELSQSLNTSVAQVDTILTRVDTFSESLARNAEGVDTFFASTNTLASDIGEITASLKSSASVIEQITAEIDPAMIGGAVNDIGSFANKLGDNADNVDVIMTNVTELSRSLNASSIQIDAILARVDSMVAGADSEGLFADISEAARSVRLLADQLNSATTGIASGLNDFTSRGLSEYTSLAVDARSTLRRLDNVVRNLEQNPQSLVFGGETVRDYTKR